MQVQRQQLYSRRNRAKPDRQRSLVIESNTRSRWRSWSGMNAIRRTFWHESSHWQGSGS